VRDLIRQGSELGEIYPAINRDLCEQMQDYGGYVTLLAAVYDPATKRLELMNAAHEPPLVVRPADDLVVELARNAPFLGVVDDPRGPARTETHVLDVQEGDVLVFYTDGVLDWYGERDEKFATEKLKQALCKAVRPGVDALALLETVAQDCERLAGRQRRRSDAALLIATF
jgi:sigma-B regulation protein RsbU (phosphoserine phosphatase)